MAGLTGGGKIDSTLFLGGRRSCGWTKHLPSPIKCYPVKDPVTWRVETLAFFVSFSAKPAVVINHYQVSRNSRMILMLPCHTVCARGAGI